MAARGRSEKALRALRAAVARHEPLADLFPLADLRPALARQLLGRMAPDAWRSLHALAGVRSARLLDLLHAEGRLAHFPAKNAAPYQVISRDDYERLVDPEEYLQRAELWNRAEDAAALFQEAAARRKESAALEVVNEEFWPAAFHKHNLVALEWAAKWFTILQPLLV